jgi:chitin disaccharide deacetylase
LSKLHEGLQFAARDRAAVIHIDDLGMCHAANEGGFAALEAGPATCGSLMVPCAWFPEAVARARKSPQLDLGVHLTLNAEWHAYRWAPVAGAARVPSLVDAQGYLWASPAETVEHATAVDVELELRTQLDRALAAGIDVTHLDSHMGTLFLRPDLTAAYLALARDSGIPPFLAYPTPELARELGLDFGALRGLAETLERDGLPVFDALEGDSLGFAPGAGEAHNRERLRRLPAGISYLVCHAAADLPELHAITQDAHCRVFEAAFYGGEPGHVALREAQVKTLGMRPVRDWWRRSRT